MEETNLLEAQLRSWQPRQPSAGLKRRIFSARLAATWFVGWLAPATACAVLTFLVLDSGNNYPGGSPRGRSVTEMMSRAVHASDGFQSGQNRWDGVIFDSTNRSGSTSSMCFTPSAKATN